MSRKRANVSVHTEAGGHTPRKRLHATLTADFESLRLSPAARASQSPATAFEPQPSYTVPQAPMNGFPETRNAFGAQPIRASPFLPPPLLSSFPGMPSSFSQAPLNHVADTNRPGSQPLADNSPLGASLAPDFRNTLPTFSHAPTSVTVTDVSHAPPSTSSSLLVEDRSKPDVSSPASSAGFIAVDDSSVGRVQASVSPALSYGNVVVEEVDDEDLTDADAKWTDSTEGTHDMLSSDDEVVKMDDDDDDGMQDEDTNSSTENRLVLYRPPVRTSGANVAVINARLPASHFAMRNSRSDDWFVTKMADAHKRHMAVVPYVSQAPPSKRRRDVYSHPVIHMPWTDRPSASSVAASAAFNAPQTPFNIRNGISNSGPSVSGFMNSGFTFNAPSPKPFGLTHPSMMHQYPIRRQQHMEISPSV